MNSITKKFIFSFMEKRFELTENNKEIKILKLLNKDLIKLEKEMENTNPTNSMAHNIKIAYKLESPSNKKSLLNYTIVSIEEFGYILENIRTENKEERLKKFRKTRNLFQSWITELEKPEYQIYEFANNKIVIKFEKETYQLIDLSKLLISFSTGNGSYMNKKIDTIKEAFDIEKKEQKKELIKKTFIVNNNPIPIEVKLNNHLEKDIVRKLQVDHNFKFKPGVKIPNHRNYYNFSKNPLILRSLINKDFLLVVFEEGLRYEYKAADINGFHPNGIVEKDSFKGNKILFYPKCRLPSIDLTDTIIYKES
jgi:hypothetical protein